MTRFTPAWLFLLATLVLCGCANSLFYHPSKSNFGTPRSAYEAVSFRSYDGTKLSAWFLSASGPAKGTVIHFHGNAQNMTAHVTYVDWLPKHGYNVLVFDYRGYGQSGGQPGRRGIFADCVSAIEYARSRDDVDGSRLLLLGQSLGAANAIAVMGHMRPAGVCGGVFDSGFYSYRAITRDKLSAIPVLKYLSWPLSFVLATNRHSPGSQIHRIAPRPMVIIHGTDDRVVPYHHGEKLAKRAGPNCELWTVEQGRHTDALVGKKRAQYRQAVLDFFARCLAKAEP